MSTSLLAPAALLAAALVVAVGGAGADAVGSLSQLTQGPDVPLSSAERVRRGAPAEADLTELEGQLSASSGEQAGTPRRAARRAGDAADTTRGSAGSGGQAGSGTGAGSPGNDPGNGPGNAPAGGQGSTPSGPAPSTSPDGPAPSAPTKSNPVGDTLDQTQQDLDNLLKPVKPITDQVLGGLGR